MSNLKFSGSKDKLEESLTSHTDQTGEQRVLPPFPRYLKVDDELKLNHETFKQKIDNFFKQKNITPLSQLTTTPTFPTTHVLAQFASKTYTDYKTGETDAQYETRLALPDGWKLLTTASNGSMNNGYFGAAYWHPENQQVVIAHRGAKGTNFGALWTEFKGILHNEYVGQMESASTFALKIVEVLQEVTQEKGVSFQLFFTGHSLGGWLAQITTFTTEYLKIVGSIFLKRNNDNDCCHPHTVVFENPGCRDMLSEMRTAFDVRHDGRSFNIEHLDITSYLAAPNRINTCNEHVGTVYRIFPDLSDMGWREKHTALYNTAMHNMDKIMEFFDPEKGQVHKDRQGKPKIRVVVDWPVTTGLSQGEEYKSFFKWAKHCNNYHPEVTDVTFQLEGYHPIRYQTKIYDKRVSRLNVFCQQERQFLKRYRWLRQLPEFFMSKEIFCVMKDSQAQEQAERILEGFEIGNDKIRCTDDSELQALIPYVKRLVQLFPEVKESTESALTSDYVRKRVYQIETRRYIERLSQSPLEFKSDALSLREFVRSHHHQVLQLQMVNVDEWTGLIKVYQGLQKTGCLTEGQYTVLKLKQLLTANQVTDFSTLMLSTVTPHLILMTCDTNELLNAEAQHIIRTIFNTIKVKQHIKIILCTSSDVTTHLSLQQIGSEIFGEGFVTRDEQLTWCDLTTSSQENLLGKSVLFQGAKISLNKLMSAESPLATLLPLGALLKGKQLNIADPVPISNTYNESYYTGNTLLYHNATKPAILTDKLKNIFPDLISSTEQEFKHICQQNPNSNVHWLEEDKSGKLLWRQSQGSLETVRRYIDSESLSTYSDTADDIDKLLEQAVHQRVMLISDTAGMGKSTVLTHLSKEIKQKFPAKWVVRIDLNDHTDELKALQQEQIYKDKAIQFIAEKVLKLKPGLEIELFKQCCEQKQELRTVIMLDGFDEISPFYQDTAIKLLQALRQTAVEQLWVTTRPHLRDKLEDKLQQLSYTLQHFEGNQIEFLKKFWSLKEWYKEMENEKKEENNKKLEIYAKELIKKLDQSISDKERECIGIPQQCRMLAEAFDEEVKTFCQSVKPIPDLSSKLDLLGLYGKFIEIKYNIYQEGKLTATQQGKSDLKLIREDHQLLALKELFTEEQLKVLQNNRQPTSADSKLSRIGIAQVSHDGKLHFIHRKFAEYYVADYLVNRLTEGNNTSQQVQTFILKVVFREAECQVIRVFMDAFLSESKLSKEVLIQYGNQIHELGKDGELTLHQSASEGNAKIIGILLDSLEAAGHTDTLVKQLLPQDEETKTAWHVAVEGGHIEVLEKLWECAEKVLNPDQLKKELLLAKDDEEMTVFHHASFHNKVQILERIWTWANVQLTPEELKEFVLTQNFMKQTAWHIAVENGNAQVLDQLWNWAEKVLKTDQINNELLLAKDFKEYTVLHQATSSNKVQILERIWKLANNQLNKEGLNKLFLAQDNLRQTAWYRAVQWGKTEVLDKLWEWAKVVLNRDELRNDLLLDKSEAGNTVLHQATFSGNVQVLERIWKWANEQLTKEELNKLLLAQDNKRITAWHLAAHRGEAEVLHKLWEWAKLVLNREELNNKLLLARDEEENTLLHQAAFSDKVQMVETLWKWAKKQQASDEINKLLLAQNNDRQTAWHIAAERSNVQVLEILWEWAKEVLNRNELRNFLLPVTH